MSRGIRFLAILLTALALVPAGAHLLELPNKMPLGRDAYFTVQQIYRGWAALGAVLIAAVLANAVAALAARRAGVPARPFAFAMLLMLATLAIFFAWTWPANQATENWTVMTEDWEAMRAQWEYAHAANAVLTFLALCCAVSGSLAPAAHTPGAAGKG